MLASLALLGILHAAADGPAFRLTVAGAPGRTVAVTAAAPRGWLAAFCTTKICGVGRIALTIPKGGARAIDLHLHRVGDGMRHGAVVVREGRESIALQF